MRCWIVMNSYKPIGGFFELELHKGREYHKHAIRLNTGRNALELILSLRQYNKVYIPYYTCDAILEPMNKLQIDYEFYSIDEKLEPIFDFNTLKEREGFLYTNYFGLKQNTVERLAMEIGSSLIVDNAQAFFAKPVKGIDTFYSARKYFGVADGAYLYTDVSINEELRQDVSFKRMTHLLKRIDLSAEEAYKDFIKNENALNDKPIMKMSKLTNSILSSIDYRMVESVRRENYMFFDKQLSGKNLLSLDLSEEVPMVYPFRTENPGLRERLISNKIFVPTYWANVFHWCKDNKLEYLLANQIIPLPIDQRYNKDELSTIIRILG